MKLVNIMVQAKLAKSKTEARNLIRQGAVTVYPEKGYKLYRYENTIISIKQGEK
jgi:ribosomal protein S4